MLHDHAPDIPGLVSIVGGKLTTYRQLAEDAVDLVFKRLGRKAPKCATAHLPVPGAVGDPVETRDFLLRQGLSDGTADRLLALYGGRAVDVLRAAADDPELTEVLHPATGAIGAELLFAVRHEFARTLTDVLARRILLAFEPGHGLEVAERAADLLGDRLGWDGERRAAELAEYRTWLTRLAVPVRGPVAEREAMAT